MSTTSAPARPATWVLPADPADRYRAAAAHLEIWLTVVSGDFVLEGRLTELFPPDMSFDNPAPVAVIDTGRARVTEGLPMPLASARGLNGSILGNVGTKTKFWQEVATTVGRGSSEPHPSWDGKPVEMVSDSDRLDGVGATSMKQEQPPGDRRESPGFRHGEDVKCPC